MPHIHAYQSRGITVNVTVKDVNGDAITLTASDKIRAIITRVGQTEEFSVVSGTASANGSTFSLNTPSSGINQLRLDASDLAGIDPGIYSLYIDIQDDSDGSEWKTAERMIISIEDT